MRKIEFYDFFKSFWLLIIKIELRFAIPVLFMLYKVYIKFLIEKFPVRRIFRCQIFLIEFYDAKKIASHLKVNVNFSIPSFFVSWG